MVKYRKQLLIEDLGQFIKDSTLEISFSVEEIEIDKDHIHILMRISPKYSISQHVRNIKQMTTSRIWRDFPALKKEFWLEKIFWSDGYFICSVGNASSDTIRKYIQEKG
jgi:putative transposase